MSKISKIVYFFISTVFFVIFDLFLSNVILENLWKLPENKFLDLIFVQNEGAAFSILQDAKFFLITFSVVAILWIVYGIIKNLEKISVFSLFWIALLIAGIFCNLYERVIFGYVRDFFKLNFINFPVFNISDIFINVSVFAIVVIIVKYNFSKNNETGN